MSSVITFLSGSLLSRTREISSARNGNVRTAVYPLHTRSAGLSWGAKGSSLVCRAGLRFPEPSP